VVRGGWLCLERVLKPPEMGGTTNAPLGADYLLYEGEAFEGAAFNKGTYYFTHR
jgi:hypothetical protein